MFRAIAFLSLLFSTAVAAHETQKVVKLPLTSEMADPAKHCVYDGKLYSRGSVVKQADGNRECEKVSFGAEPFMLGWDKAK